MISTLDTHELVKDLKASGFTDAQAEAVTRAVRQAHDFSDLATKSDLALLRGEIRGEIGELRREIGEVRGELRGEIGEVRREIGEVRGELRGEIGEVRREIGEVRGELRGEIGEVRREIAALELRLIKWVVGVGIAAALAVGGMIWTATQVVLRALPHL